MARRRNWSDLFITLVSMIRMNNKSSRRTISHTDLERGNSASFCDNERGREFNKCYFSYIVNYEKPPDDYDVWPCGATQATHSHTHTNPFQCVPFDQKDELFSAAHLIINGTRFMRPVFNIRNVHLSFSWVFALCGWAGLYGVGKCLGMCVCLNFIVSRTPFMRFFWVKRARIGISTFL